MSEISNKTKTCKGEILMSGKLDDLYADDGMDIMINIGMKETSLANTSTEKEEFTSRETIDVDVIPPAQSWPYRPLFIQADTKQCSGLVVDGIEPKDPVPIGKVFKFESDLFQGEGLIRIRRTNTKKSNENEENDYFKDRKRFHQIVIQGKFKEKLRVSDVVTGRYYEKPLQKTPPKFFARVMKKFISVVAPGVEIDLGSKQPKVQVNLAASAQILRADKEGHQPDISSPADLSESSFAFGRQFSNSKQRKSVLSNPKSEEYFDTKTIYTFVSYDDILDFWSYNLSIASFNIDMTKIINRQPFQYNAMKKLDGKYLWLFQIWHERLLSS